jgi:hypothetical protein
MQRQPVFICARVRASQPGDGLPRADAATLDAYARAAMRDSIDKGEAPFPWVGLGLLLQDDVAQERAAALETCLAWLPHAVRVVIYSDFGISTGMSGEIDRAQALGIKLEIRSLNVMAK